MKGVAERLFKLNKLLDPTISPRKCSFIYAYKSPKPL
uniref:Uncharacterized protein n=1 Tax=Anguilla anguilla TaxID=7936 RepID=A0A0E9V2P0_ANGAN